MIEPILNSFEAYLREQIKFEKEAPQSLYTPITYAMQLPAKRVRPLACLLSCHIFDSAIEKYFPLAYVFELFHNFTLVHDDIIDDAPLRRGQASVFKKFNTNQAILSGDLMLITCFEILQKLDSKNIDLIRETFIQTAIEVCEGQQMDIDFEKKSTINTQDYIQMIRLKTAVLLACSLKCGALSSGASLHDADLLYQYGIDCGIIFQIKDDLLDVYSDASGKQKAGDIVNNKKTLLYTTALEKLSYTNQQRLLELYTNQCNDENEKIKEVIALFDSVNVKLIIEKHIEDLQYKSNEILNKISVQNEALKMFQSYVNTLLHRMV